MQPYATLLYIYTAEMYIVNIDEVKRQIIENLAHTRSALTQLQATVS